MQTEKNIIEPKTPIASLDDKNSIPIEKDVVEEDVVDMSTLKSLPSTTDDEIQEKPSDLKPEKLEKEQIEDFATGYGACFATDRITVDGKKVGYMYREEASFPNDSGWRFFSGDETLDYLTDKKNTKIYDVNTIANYDKDIISFLDSGEDSVFERDSASGRLKKVNE